MTSPTNSSKDDPSWSLPIVSLAQWQTAKDDKDETACRQLADQVREICHTTGFFLLQDHGISSEFLQSTFALSEQLFALPPETKQRIDKRRSPHFRGWESEGSEYTNNNRPDHREQVDLWTEHPPVGHDDGDDPSQQPDYLKLLGPNQWFSDPSVLPHYRAHMDEWFRQTKRVADTLMEVLAVGLGLEASYFDDHVFGDPDRRMSLTKLVRYPPTPAGGAGVNAHHDAGFLTLLACRTTPGLQVWQDSSSGGGDWKDVIPPTPDTLVVNLGELLQATTGHYYVATAHRVVVPPGVRERYAVGYFHGPSLDAPLLPLPLDETYRRAVANSPRHRQAGYMARRDETTAGVGDMQSSYQAKTYGEQLWNYFQRSYPQHMARHYPELVTTTTASNASTDPDPNTTTTTTVSSSYEIPSFWDILLQSEFRIVHQPPPLQIHEAQDDRDYVDWLLQHFWDPADSRALLNQHDEILLVVVDANQTDTGEEETGKEFTYGEVTSTGVRQLLEDMELLQTDIIDVPCNDSMDNGGGSNNNNNNQSPIVFYDLGSGEGKLVIQLLLECLLNRSKATTTTGETTHQLPRAIGVELHPARHAMAVQSWDKLHKYLMGEEQASTSNGRQEAPNMADSQFTEAKIKLQEKYRAIVQQTNTYNTNNNRSLRRMVELVQGDLLDYDFSDATHIFASSIFFPKPVLRELCRKINDHAVTNSTDPNGKSKLRVVAALSDLEWLEEPDGDNSASSQEKKAWGDGCCPWEKRVQRLQMTWGGANVRLYFRKDY